ncbi:mycofactocin system FadH/OYE family oxidoreductase 1 [Rhodococcus spongiicola]|uniref:Mycofactocin system FadH/OYE family oxidoreductase 1 n=1 Tax=Rhodococcus spongiicola TaxID=2487352 RepID=A0A3S3BHL7_9NOCA|nr:mycofactocin system FadH/OYE family oxidoreductase 1 [Rhodococcus spongiicola]RVW01483.1 mycofactocin system FadH/OYE family oxidoreductase 1 [Rhodococcus spongiicola]
MSDTLTEQLTLAGRTAPSRVMFGPHETNLGDGRALSPRHVAYYARRARGGTGVIVTETASVHPSDWPYERAPSADECADGWRDVVAACRPHGTLVLAGLGHTGLQGSSAYSQSVLWGPSWVPDVVTREMPMEMERTEIAALVAGFRSATAAVVEAGCDGVELDAGPSSLLRQFHSGLTNLRDDEYGADPLRLTREVLAAVRAELGPGRVLALRLSCDEQAPWAGVTPAQGADQARALAPELDLLVVVRGGTMSTSAYRPDFHAPPAFNTELCRAVRAAVAGVVPVVLQGSVVDPVEAQHALDAGVADAVEMTRAQIADPDLVSARRAGRRPRPCVRCNQACLVRDPRNPVVTCIGNPAAGYESVDPPEADAEPLRGPAVVVGTGPAGLEAARVLAGRGARVTAVEAGPRAGGMVRTVSADAPHLVALTDWLEDECRSRGVEFRTQSPVSESDLDGWERDGIPVVLATGSMPRPLPFPVHADIQCHDAAAVLAGAVLEQGPIVLYDPVGGPVAVALAEWLAADRSEVAILTPDTVTGSRLGMTGDLADASARLHRAGVTRYLTSRIVSGGSGTLRVRSRYTGEESTVPCAVLIDCSHRLPDERLRTSRRTAMRVGDCVAPRTILEAIREGRAAALAAPGLGSDSLVHNRFTMVTER